jgi:hypothetical protein
MSRRPPRILTPAELEAVVPQVVSTMRRYLEQIACVLHPAAWAGADLALRSPAGFLAERAPKVTSTAQVIRRHLEDDKPWLARGRDRTTRS